MRSFADPDTTFHLVRSQTPVNVDGFKLGEPTGEVECLECGAVEENIDEISHEPDCPQRFVHSRWYAEMMDQD
ncbi:hypothetical protein GWK26_12780 [haloarchaeon 3A1-DGR]|nr:hypothetical protein GWK26_12780 [haloarchaeon 3A1-DGR]